MRPSHARISVAASCLVALFVISASACRESPPEADAEPAEAAAVPSPVEPSPPDEKITELRREIEAQRQSVDDLQAAVDMEHAKLDEDPEYDQSFLLDVLEEQDELREEIKEGEARLKELTNPGS